MPSSSKRGLKPNPQSSDLSPQKYHFLGIGINEYQNFTNLNNAVKDVHDIVAILVERYYFENENVTLLFDENATRENIILKLDELVDRLTENDSLLIYYSGHGHLSKSSKRGFWIPHDATPGSTSYYIRNSTIRDYIKDFECKHVLLLSDAAFSGSLLVR